MRAARVGRTLFAVAVAAAVVAAVVVCLVIAVPRGLQRRTLVVDGLPRSYLVHVPERVPSRPALVLALHGRGGDGAGFARRTGRGFERLARGEGFVVVYPEGSGKEWNSGHPWETSESDDVGFLSALVSALSAEFDVNPERVYMTGLSNGAAMTYRFACERPEEVAAIAPVAGGLSKELMPTCANPARRPVPLLVMHGTADPIVPFDSGELEGNLWQWVDVNGCARSPHVTRLPDSDPSDGARTRVETHGSCRDGADVVLYAIEGGGHHWPGGSFVWKPGRGHLTRDFDASVVIWDFFARHPMR